jgi:hypothetical protein
MRSPQSVRRRGDPDEVDHTVQDTLDAFQRGRTEEVQPPREDGGTGDPTESGDRIKDKSARQASIDAFLTAGAVPPQVPGHESPTRAMEGIALEMSMEGIALTEAATGITRDELLVTIAREIQLPLQRLDLVDGYITDLELEGKVRRVGDLVVLARPGDEDLLSMGLDETDFMERYRRRYLTGRGGGG